MFQRNIDLKRRRKAAKAHRRASRHRLGRLLAETLEQRIVLTQNFFPVTNTNASGAGSLAAEVALANASTDEAIVDFDPTVFGTHQTITLTATLTLDHASEPKIPISIVGPAAGVTIAGGGSGSDFSVITVTSDTQQAAIKGDSPSAPITITAGNLTGSSESGAGIDDLGDLVLENVVVTNNTSAGSGGGVEVLGGPNIFTSNPGAALLASDTTFSGNSAAGAGGGVDMEGSAALIVNSTFSGNTAGTTGGGFNNGNMLIPTFLVPLNLGVINSTFADNHAANDGGGIDNANGGIMGIINSVVADNTVGASGTNPDVDGGSVYNGSSHDVIGDSNGLSGTGISDGSNGNVVGHPALLAPLGAYGGANASGTEVSGSGVNQTIALLPGSPAINDAVALAGLTADASNTTTTLSAGTPLPLLSLNGSTFPYQRGKVILIGSEKMLVTGVSGSAASGYTLTVTRGVDGTTAAMHHALDPIFLPDERGIFATSSDSGAFQTEGFNLAVIAGDTPQSAQVASAFANPLGVTVTANDPNAPVDGGVVAYTVPTSGASATLASGTATISGGTASVNATANGSKGSYTVSATAGFGTNATFSLTNTPAPSTISATAVSVASTEGATFSGTVATFTDSDATLTSPGDFTATIDWGDGHTTSGSVTAAGTGFAVSGSHQYLDEANLSAVVTIGDSDGSTTSVTASAAISDATLTAGSAVTISPTEGVTFSGVVGSFTDANTGAPPGDFTATITWGDGATTTGTVGTVAGVAGSFQVAGTHVFGDETASSSTSIGVVDVGGSPVTLTGSASVGDATLTPTSLTFGAVAGATFNGTVATFTDANSLAAATDFTATIDWGDGTSATVGSVVAATGGGFDVTGSHVYAQTITQSVTVTIDDVGGATAAVTSTAVFTDLVVSTSAVAIAPTEGVGFAGTVATFTGSESNGSAADFTASIVWGDGATTTGSVSGSAAAGYSVSGSHTYAEEATAVPLAIVVADPVGDLTTITSQTNVADATLTTLPLTVAATEGIIFTGNVATFADANPAATAGDFTASIAWGDGQTSPGTVSAAAGGGFAVYGTHVYSDEASYVGAVVAIRDIGGSTATASNGNTAVNMVTVADATLTALPLTVAATEGITFTGNVATFADGNSSATAGDFTATIAWGDGQTSPGTVSAAAGGGFAVYGTHVYSDEASYVGVVVAISDSGGSTATASNGNTAVNMVTVADATLTAKPSTVITSQGATFSGTVATFTDANPLATAADFTATINWGDGHTTTGSVSAAAGGGFQVTGSHQYTGFGAFTIGLSLADSGGVNTPVNVQATVKPPPHEAYVIAVYLDVLGRVPDAAGLAYWAGLLDGGTAISSVAQAIGHSNEYYASFVIEPAYLKLLARTADNSGVTYWTQLMQNGLTDQELEAGFIASDEFYAKAGENFDPGKDADDTGTTDLDHNTDWIDAVYKLLLGRTADSAGETYWNGQLAAGVSRSDVALRIAGGTENDTQLINSDYIHYLGRPADSAGLAFWLTQFAAGQTNEDVIAGFTGSPEYYKEHTS